MKTPKPRGLSDLPRITQLESGRAKKRIQEPDSRVHAVNHYDILSVGDRRMCNKGMQTKLMKFKEKFLRP